MPVVVLAPPTTQLVLDGNLSPVASYAVGLTVGRHLRAAFIEDGMTADTESILVGMRDGLAGRKPPHDEDRIEEAVLAIEHKARLRQAQKRYDADPAFRKMADENLMRAREQMDRYSRRAGVEKLPNGVLFQTLVEGEGDFVAGAEFVTAHFAMYTGDLVKVRSTDPGKPTELKLSRIKPVVADVVRECRVGGTYRVAIPPELAFGLAGNPPVVGPNQAILMQFEIVSAR